MHSELTCVCILNIPLTLSVCHAVEEDPVLSVWSIFDEGHIVACLDAEHSEQLHFVSDHSVRVFTSNITLWDFQGCWFMAATLRMGVHLKTHTHY